VEEIKRCVVNTDNCNVLLRVQTWSSVLSIAIQEHVDPIFGVTVSAVMMQNGYMGRLQGWWPVRNVERTVADRTWARQPGLVNGKCETRNRNSVFPTVI